MVKQVFCVEVGGTFTDWVLVENDRVAKTGKVLSTPEPSKGVMNAVQDGLTALADVSAVIHGSTVATNAVLERKGAVTGLLTTKGFRDVLQIQRQSKTKLFDLFYRQPEPLVTRDRIIEVTERMGPHGEVWHALALDDLPDRLHQLVEEGGTESLAICLLHSYANPEHELQLARYLEDHFPDLYVTLSSEVLPRFREYERMSTCTISAYVKPRVDRYVADLEHSLHQAGFAGHMSIVQANGGTIPASEARRHAAKMILSGPAAGVIGAIASARASGFANLLTFDMGGTSTDVCLVTNGQTEMSTEYKIGGLPLGIPMIDIVTVGAGGGSMAKVDSGGALRVGPESAGADPGPACYGKGGYQFTVTDANVILGLLNPATFYGGRMLLSTEAASSALDPLVEQLGSTREQVADGVVRLANATMAQAMRLVSVERGHDPRDYTIVAYGGAGPLHAVALAEELAVGNVLIPESPGLLSAYGLMLADVRQDYLRSHIVALERLEPDTFRRLFEELAGRAREEFSRYGLGWENVEVLHSLDMRYEGQAYELKIDVDDAVTQTFRSGELMARFKETHHLRYGHTPSGDEIEIVTFRLTARLPSGMHLFDLEAAQPQGELQFTDRAILIAGVSTPCRFFQRSSLAAGYTLPGPAVIEEPTATTYLPRGWKAQVDDVRNLVLSRDRRE